MRSGVRGWGEGVGHLAARLRVVLVVVPVCVGPIPAVSVAWHSRWWGGGRYLGSRGGEVLGEEQRLLPSKAGKVLTIEHDG